MWAEIRMTSLYVLASCDSMVAMNRRAENPRSISMVSRICGRRVCIFLVNGVLCSFWSLPPAQADEVRWKI